MKRAKSLVFILLIIFSLFITESLTNIISVSSSSNTLNITHQIEVLEGGTIVIKDIVNLNNNDEKAVTNFEIGFNSIFSKHLDKLIINDYEGKKLGYMNKTLTENVYLLNVTFPKAIQKGGFYNFTVTTVFSGLIKANFNATSYYKGIFPKYPWLSTNASVCEVKIILPSTTTLKNSSWDTIPLKQLNLMPFSNDDGYILFDGIFQLVESSLVIRRIEIDPSESVLFFDTQTIRNLGKDKISQIILTIPNSSINVYAYDSFGGLETKISSNNAIVILRYPLRGDDGVSNYKDSYTFTISYRVDGRKYLNITTHENHLKFETNIFSNILSTIYELRIEISLPEGSDYISSSPVGILSKTGYIPVVNYLLSNVTKFTDRNLEVEYNYSIVWSAFRPLLFIGTLIVLVGVLVFNKGRKRERDSNKESDEYSKSIKTFSDLYEGRIVLLNEMESLQKSLETRKIGRKEYKQKIFIISQKFNILNREINNIKKKIKIIGPKYNDSIVKLERLESELNNAKAEKSRTNEKYHSGTLQKDVYEDLKRESERKIDKINRQIEETIFDIKNQFSK